MLQRTPYPQAEPQLGSARGNFKKMYPKIENLSVSNGFKTSSLLPPYYSYELICSTNYYLYIFQCSRIFRPRLSRVISFKWRNGHHHQNRNASKYWGKIVSGLSHNIIIVNFKKMHPKIINLSFSDGFKTSSLQPPYYSYEPICSTSYYLYYIF